jgi:ATP-dependent Clp protease ATP-binding subunit ClpB
VHAVQKLQEQLDQARSDVEVAQRKGDLQRASELMYGVIPNLQSQIASAQQTEEQEAKSANLSPKR